MGDIADMMLDGTMCEGCGSFLDDEGYGIPRYCSNECAKDRGFDGIQTDGAGSFNKHKTQRESCLTLNMTHNGRMLFDDRKKLQYKNASYQKSKEFAKKVRELADKYFKEESDERQS